MFKKQNVNKTYFGNDDNESQYYKPEEYIGRTSFFTIVKNKFLYTNCTNEECSLCYNDTNNDTCITCKYGYTQILNRNKICKKQISTTFPVIETTIPIIQTTIPIKETISK